MHIPAEVVASPRASLHALARLVIFLCLLAAEDLFASRFYGALDLVVTGKGFGWLGYSGQAAQVGITFALSLGLALGPRLSTWYKNFIQQANGHSFAFMLIAQLVAYSAFILLAHKIYVETAAAQSFGPLVPLLWMSLLLLIVGLWLLAVAPLKYWIEIAHAERLAMGIAAVVAIFAWGIAQFSQQLWSPLSKLTFFASSSLLGAIYPQIVLDADRYVLGTPQFQVEIGSACSGYEGIGLVIVFTSFYLSIFRREFKFPQALLLLPIGIVTIWLFNAVRIVLLVMIGHELSPTIAVGGFHSHAGWISFILVTVGMLAIAYKMAFFSVERPAHGKRASVKLPAAMLAPLVVLLSSTLLTSALSADVDWLYPTRVLATGVVLIVLWRHYDFFPHQLSPAAIGAGLVVFLLWIVLAPADPDQSKIVATQLDSASGIMACLWIIFRLLGAVVTVPLAEELAFRGYLMGRLSGWKFSPGARLRRSWFALILSSVLFGLLHSAWVAGTIAGLIYGLVRYHRDKVADAVVAHAVTNFLLAGYVLTTGAWSLW